MVRITACTGVLFAMLVAPVPAAQPFSVTIDKEIDLPKETIYARTLKWTAESFSSSHTVIETADKARGLIVGSGTVDATTGWAIFKRRVPMRVKLTVSIQNSKYALTFTDVQVGGQSSQFTAIEQTNSADSEEAARDAFGQLANRLQTYLLKPRLDE